MKLLGYNLLFPVAFILYLPIFVFRLLRRGGVSSCFLERFGIYSRERREACRAVADPVWVHAVSVGEVVAALTFLRRWQERDPERRFVLSTTTTTGHAVAEKKLPDGIPLIYCPLDFWPFVASALNLIRPSMLVIFEVEVWPNLVLLARRRNIPVVLVNGRMSDRSADGYSRHRWFFGSVFESFSSICVQSDQDAERVRRVVGDRVPVAACNTMKFDQIPDAAGADKEGVLNDTFGPDPRRIWIAGSTHSGEEALVADTFTELKQEFPDLKLILVPRHCERTPEVRDVLNGRGLSYRLLCPRDGEEQSGSPVDILVVNTTGELMNFFAVADVVFVGKSLAGQEGGHNIIEPAIFGKAIVHGAAMQNFRLVVKVFKDRDAVVEVGSDAALAEAVRQLLRDPDKRRQLGERARQVVDEQRGAISKTLDTIQPLLDN